MRSRDLQFRFGDFHVWDRRRAAASFRSRPPPSEARSASSSWSDVEEVDRAPRCQLLARILRRNPNRKPSRSSHFRLMCAPAVSLHYNPPVLAIETLNLRKQYGKTPVLHDLNLHVNAGSVFGFL